MDLVALAGCTSEELGDALGQVHALENAVRSSLLELISVCDERMLWTEDGASSIECWVGMRLGVAWRTAAELVRVARAIGDLPAIAAAFASGALSWDRLRALATIADPDSDAEWARTANHMPVSRLAKFARRHRERSEAEAAAAKAGQGLKFSPDPDHPVTRIRSCMPNATAQVIQKAIEREADKISPNAETGELVAYASRRVQSPHTVR